MQYLFDETGRRYLDAFAGIVTVSCGHCHPDILNAITEQSKLLQHATTIYLHHAIGDFAEALAAKMPGNLKVLEIYRKKYEASREKMMLVRFLLLLCRGISKVRDLDAGCILCEFWLRS